MPGGEGWAHPKGGSEKAGTCLGHTAGQGRGGTGRSTHSGVTSLAAPPPPPSNKGGERYMCKWACVWPDLATHLDPPKQSNYLVISDRSLFLREFSGHCECGLVL